jgi:hypothetical protein
MNLYQLGLKGKMATTKLKTGKVITLPFDEMLTFIARNEHLIENEKSTNPRPRRRLLAKSEHLPTCS